MKACATSSCGSLENARPSGGGNRNPALLSNGFPDSASNLEFHMSRGKNAVFSTIGARRMLRGPVRWGPTIPLFSMPIAIGCVSPKPLVGE